MKRGIRTKGVCENIKVQVKNIRENNDEKHFLIEKLLSKSNVCPEDQFYLEKLSELLIEFEMKENHLLEIFKKDNETINDFVNKCQTEIKKRNEINQIQYHKIKELEDENEDLVYHLSDMKKKNQLNTNKIRILEDENEDLVYHISDLKKKMR